MTMLTDMVEVVIGVGAAGAIGWSWWRAREATGVLREIVARHARDNPVVPDLTAPKRPAEPWGVTSNEWAKMTATITGLRDDLEGLMEGLGTRLAKANSMLAHLQERVTWLEDAPAKIIPSAPAVDHLAIMDRMAASQQLALDTIAKIAAPVQVSEWAHNPAADELTPTADVYNGLDPTDLTPGLEWDALRDLTGVSYNPGAPGTLVDNPIGIAGLQMPEGGWPQPVPGSWGLGAI